MRLRRAVAADARRLHLLESELFEAANFPLSRRAFYYHIRHSLLYVAETEEGDIAGYALSLIRRRDAKLYSLGVAPACRGSGVAALLTAKMLGELASLGFKRTLLEVRCDNEQAISLYERFGFSRIKRLKAFYLDGCDACLMETEHAGKTL